MNPEIKLYIPNFEPRGHIYAKPDDGMLMDSVTMIIKAECGLYQFKDNLPAERGTAFHKATHYYDEKDLDETKLPENLKPYLEQYIKALAVCKIKVLANEQMRYHPTYLYAGTLDKIALVDGVLGIIDLKTGQEYLDHKWQLAAYEAMVKHEYPGKVLHRWNLYIQPNKYKLIEQKGASDFREFLTLYGAHTIKVNYGFRKRKTEETYDGD